MNYAAGPTLVTGEGKMRKGNVLFLLLVSSGWIIFSTQYAVCCKQMHIDCIAWIAILRAADRQFGRIEQDFVLFRFVCQQTKTAPHDKLQ